MSKARARHRLLVLGLCCFGASLPWRTAAQPLSDRGEPTATQLAESLRAWLDGYRDLGGGAPAETLEEFRPGYLEQFQLRTESDRLDPGRQRYAVRLLPKLPHVRRAERRLQEAERTALAERPLDARRDADAAALRQLFDAAGDAAELRLIDSLIDLQRQLVEVTLRRLAEPNYDVGRVLDAQDDLSDLELRRERLDARIGFLSAPLPFDRLIAVGDLSAALSSLSTLGPQLPAEPSRLAILDAELALERAENQRWLDFVQVDYRSDLLDPNRRYSIGGGVELPLRPRTITAIDKLAVQKQQLALDEALDLRVATAELTEDLNELAAALVAYRALERSLELRRANRLPLERVLREQSETQPESILRLRRRNLSDRMRLLEEAADIRAAYARMLGRHFALTPDLLARHVVRP